jgi:hypothetical protein
MSGPAPGGDVAASEGVVDTVIERLEDVIAWAIAAQSPIGYFAAVYCGVTRTIADGLRAGIFDDGPRMAHLDDVFASRFIDAFDHFRSGAPATAAWQLAFDASRLADIAILQQLLLGINAHIRLDLGIAAASVAPGGELAMLRGDFDRINAVLDSLVPSDRSAMDRVSPGIRELDRFRHLDDLLTEGWILAARDQAWDAASRLAPMADDARAAAIDQLDQEVKARGARMLHPEWPLRAALEEFVIPRESRDVAANISALR